MAEKEKNRKRVTTRVHPDTYKQLEYWSARKGRSISEYVEDAINFMIAYENKDYDLPTAEMNRLAQIIDVLESLSSNTQSLEAVVVHGFDSLLNLTKGSSYLLEEDVDDDY